MRFSMRLLGRLAAFYLPMITPSFETAAQTYPGSQCPGRIVVWGKINSLGESQIIDNRTTLTKSLQQEVSSLCVKNDEWIAFYENQGFSDDDAVLWIRGPCYISTLHNVRRPHANNYWGDRIRAVDVPNPPHGPNTKSENSTIHNCGH